MSDPGHQRIKLNKADLLHLCDLIHDALPSSVPLGFAAGWNACLAAIQAVAAEMPDGCVLVSEETSARFLDEYNHRGRVCEAARRAAVRWRAASQTVGDLQSLYPQLGEAMTGLLVALEEPCVDRGVEEVR